MKKVVCMVLAAVMLMACLAGCGSTPASTPEDSASAAFKIGGTAPLTGGGMTWNEQGQVTKSPKGMVIQNGAYVGLD